MKKITSDAQTDYTRGAERKGRTKKSAGKVSVEARRVKILTVTKTQSIQAIRKQIRAHANASTVFVDINGSSVKVRSVEGILVMPYDRSDKEELISAIDKIKSNRIIKTII
jgi:hypothetical protein